MGPTDQQEAAPVELDGSAAPEGPPDEAPAESDEPVIPLRGVVWWGWIAALTLLQLLIRLWSVLGLDSYHDDIDVTYRALVPMGSDFLLGTYAGHWGPVGRLLEWVTVNAAPFDVGVAFGIVLILVLLADLGMLLALKQVFGRGLASILIYAGWAFTPVIVTTVISWSLGLNLMLLTVWAAWTTYFHSRAVMTGSAGSTVAAIVGLALLLLSSPQGLVLLMFLVVANIAYPRWSRYRIPISQSFRDTRSIWIGYFTVAVVYGGLYASASPSRVTNPFSFSNLMVVLREMMLGVAFPSLLGGAWGSDPGALPSSGELSLLALTFVAQVVALVVVTSISMRAWAWRAWAGIAALVFAQSMVVAVAVRFDEIDGLLRQTRYLVPILVPTFFLLGAAFTLGPKRAWYSTLLLRPRGRAFVGAVGVGLVVLYLESAWVTTYRVDSEAKAASTREFWSNVRESFPRYPGVSIVDRTMPESVLFAGFLPHLGSASMSLRYYVSDQTWNTPAQDLHLVTDEGRLVPARVEPFGRSLPGPAEGCGYLVEDTDWTEIPVDQSQFNWGWGVKLNYLSSEATEVQVLASGVSTPLSLEAGIGNITWINPGIVDRVQIKLSDPAGGPVCVDYLVVGGLVPK